MRRLICRAGAFFALGFLVALPAAGFGARSHQIVAAIAWQYLDPPQRAMVNRLLEDPPPCLKKVIGKSDGPLSAFMRAGLFPDVVRRQHGCQHYDNSHWHFINQYWGQAALPTPREADNIVTVLTQLSDKWRRGSASAIDLAWIIHLVADVHQPLHVASRVSHADRRGDAGGNSFALRYDKVRKCRVCGGIDNLHAYWDKVLEFEGGKGGLKGITAKARELERRYEVAVSRRLLNNLDFAAWAKEGLEISRSVIYSPYLEEGGWPDAAYEKMAIEISGQAVVMAAYRLAYFLNQAR